MASPVRLRSVAARDVDDAVGHLVDAAGAVVAARFVDALEGAVTQLGRHPRSGSLHFGYELDLPDLRSWPIDGFPCVVFYVARPTEVDVWRVLHSRRDIASLLAEGR